MITKISKNLFKVFYPGMDKPLFLTEFQLRDCYNVLLDCGLIPN